MESPTDNTPLIVVVGETASGKSALALNIAEQFDGEIICADSRTIYSGMDIGTAKPTAEDRARVPHYLLDVVTPDQAFTAFDFKRLTEATISDIGGRSKLPILVGGSGLYVDAVLYDFQFRSPADPSIRERFQTASAEELRKVLQAVDIPLPKDIYNPRHLIRALETGGQSPTRSALRQPTLIIGLQTDREVLLARVTRRVDAMIDAGLVDEVRVLADRYDMDLLALSASGYKAFSDYLIGTESLEGARRQLIQNHMQLAKRQRTWFRRNKSIHWINKREEAVDLITTFLNK